MYCKYYGFKEKPFNVTSDPSFFFLSRKHKEAIASMFYGLNERKGIITVTGEIGVGKTTLCRLLLNKLDKSVKTAVILNPYFSEVQLLKFIVSDFGIEVKKKTRLDIINKLNEFLLNEHSQGNNAAIIIDEAQNLKPRQLEQIRLLSNLETEKEKLLQIILIGQPELRVLLDRPELRQVKQRVMVDYHIQPLDMEEVIEYVNHRLNIAKENANTGVGFSPEAIRKIFEFSAGIPRLINMACDRSLLAGFISEKNYIDDKIVGDSISDITLNRMRQGNTLAMAKAIS